MRQNVPAGSTYDWRVTSNTERMASGDWYLTDESVLEIQRERQAVMELYNASPVADPIRRRELLVELMGTVGEDVEVRSPVYVDYGSNVHIGTGVFLNYGANLPTSRGSPSVTTSRSGRTSSSSRHCIPSRPPGVGIGGRPPNPSRSGATSGWPPA